MAINPIAPEASNREFSEGPSGDWTGVTAEDINAGFKAIKVPKPKKNNFPRASNKFRPSAWRDVDEEPSKFITGSSRFIFVVYKIVSVRKPAVKKEALNINVTVSPRDKKRFASSLEKAIDSTERFFFDSMLPITESLHTAIKNAEERYQILTGSPAEIPRDWFVSKAVFAYQLRITRQVAELFELTDEEQELINSRFHPPRNEKPSIKEK